MIAEEAEHTEFFNTEITGITEDMTAAGPA